MRSSLLSFGTVPALVALALFGHPPASAGSIMLRSGLCGSAGIISIPLKRVPRSKDDQRPCSTGCHAACSARKRLLLDDDA